MTALTRLLPASLILLLAACTSPSLEEGVASEFSEEGLAAVRNSGFEEAFVPPGAQLPGYAEVTFPPMDFSRLQVTQTTVSGTTRGQWQMTPEREQGLRQSWEAATSRAFGDYPRGEGGELRIESSLVQVAPGRGTSSATSAAGTPMHGTSDVVNLSVEFRIFNNANDQLLAVIRDRRSIASLQWNRAAGADTVNLFNSWAALLHTRVSGR